ncbi:MarR family transcriptional regulator [Enterococcus viikkiensis]|uniref:MarR family transcriptional regulator n=1 Tax=Enterococcus viikkiensis TaxID=930854 RepID=A0ABU3FTN1_9ENTE|nr:MarR family transcriptional regulator [Enterococcus viikkiensis]MDT2829062.1 MarR family transcriptional regulator [Enterococcus viikkiensis]
MSLQEISHLMYLVKLIDQKISSTFEAKIGFSLTRYELLMTIAKLEPCLQTQLQEQMQIDQAAITRHLKILEEKNYVTRKRNESNQREIFVRLTDRAHEEMAACEEEHQSLREVMYPFLTETEMEQLAILLTKLNDNL